MILIIALMIMTMWIFLTKTCENHRAHRYSILLYSHEFWRQFFRSPDRKDDDDSTDLLISFSLPYFSATFFFVHTWATMMKFSVWQSFSILIREIIQVIHLCAPSSCHSSLSHSRVDTHCDYCIIEHIDWKNILMCIIIPVRMVFAISKSRDLVASRLHNNYNLAEHPFQFSTFIFPALASQ